MKFTQILYLTLLTISWLLSIWCYKKGKSIKIFPFLLSVSLLTEILVDIFYYILHWEYSVIYHLYTPVEYALFSHFFYYNLNNKALKKVLLLTIPSFLILSLFISFKIVGISKYVGMNDNLEGILLILWSIITLFSIEFNPEFSIIQLPVFWICVAVIIFHSGIFLFNGVYDSLLAKKSPLAEILHQMIIKNLNYVLYILFSIAFICSNRMKKYSLQ